MNPTEALELYLDARRSDGDAQATIATKARRVGFFVEWLTAESEASLTELTGMDLHKYKVQRGSQLETGGTASKRTQQSRMTELKVFLEWCVSVDLVDPTLPEKVPIPSPNGTPRRDAEIDADRARTIMDWLAKYRYASRDHAVMSLFFYTGGRQGDVRALDRRDFYPDGSAETDHPHVWIRHRPETGTPLKNGTDGERPVSLSPGVVTVLNDYVAYNRVQTTDDDDREPLLTTGQGRVSKSTVKRTVYRISRPCVYTGECPHGRSQSDCEATQRDEHASKCPSSEASHAVRRGVLTQLCREDKPMGVISDRCNVGPQVLEEHYNTMGELEKMEQRREYL